ncbi:MAG TPA: hypothetical protein VLB51_06255 [Methylomirabilota bacterium]|nr:hypothetical protein [Methylomirabilota bacterium]
MRALLATCFTMLAALPVVAADEVFTISVATDRAAYQVGETVEILFTVANASAEAQILPYPCPCCVHEMWIENAFGEVVATELQLACPQVTGEWRFGPFESRIFALHTWWQEPGDFPFPNPPQAETVPPGTYRVVVEWHSKGRTVSAPFVICEGTCPEPRSLVLPAAGNNPGLHGAVWTTDLEMHSLGGGDAVVTMSLLAHGVGNPQPATREVPVPNHGTRRLTNVLGEWFDHHGPAALHLEVRGGDVHISSRTFTTDDEGTYGQAVPAVPASDARPRLLLPNLRHAAGEWRTNIGLVNLRPEMSSVRVVLHPRPAGGPAHPVDVVLAPYEYRQLNDVFAPFVDLPVLQGHAWVEVEPPGLVLAYASVVDNRSGDAVFTPGVPGSSPWAQVEN